jgi:hypothetical protein
MNRPTSHLPRYITRPSLMSFTTYNLPQYNHSHEGWLVGCIYFSYSVEFVRFRKMLHLQIVRRVWKIDMKIMWIYCWIYYTATWQLKDRNSGIRRDCRCLITVDEHVFVAMDTYATLEELVEAVFSVRSLPRLHFRSKSHREKVASRGLAFKNVR